MFKVLLSYNYRMTTNSWILLEFRNTTEKTRVKALTGKSLQKDKGQEQPAELTHSKHTPISTLDAACSHEPKLPQ